MQPKQLIQYFCWLNGTITKQKGPPRCKIIVTAMKGPVMSCTRQKMQSQKWLPTGMLLETYFWPAVKLNGLLNHTKPKSNAPLAKPLFTTTMSCMTKVVAFLLSYCTFSLSRSNRARSKIYHYLSSTCFGVFEKKKLSMPKKQNLTYTFPWQPEVSAQR